MGFVLGAWDAARPPRVGEAEGRYAQLQAGEDPAAIPSRRVDAFLTEAAALRPVEAVDGSPPPFTTRRTPSAVLLDIGSEVATELFGQWAALAERHGLVLYDPQSGVVQIPSRLSYDAQPPRRDQGWFGRRRR